MLQTFRINYGAVSENRSKFCMMSLSPALTHTDPTGTSSLLVIRDICGRRTVHETENLWNRIAAMSDIRKRDAGTSSIAITAAAEVFAEYVI